MHMNVSMDMDRDSNIDKGMDMDMGTDTDMDTDMDTGTRHTWKYIYQNLAMLNTATTRSLTFPELVFFCISN